MHEIFDLVINFVVLIAWGFLFWAAVKDNRARKSEHAKNRNLLVKTFWVLFFGAILWFVVGVASIVAGTPFLLESFLTFVLGYKAYELNKMLRVLKTKP